MRNFVLFGLIGFLTTLTATTGKLICETNEHRIHCGKGKNEICVIPQSYCKESGSICRLKWCQLKKLGSPNLIGNCPKNKKSCKIEVCTVSPTVMPTVFNGTGTPTNVPTFFSSLSPTGAPTGVPTNVPTFFPSLSPTGAPTGVPTNVPTFFPSLSPTGVPTNAPTFFNETEVPTGVPTNAPTFFNETGNPTGAPTFFNETEVPTGVPTNAPTEEPNNNNFLHFLWILIIPIGVVIIFVPEPNLIVRARNILCC